jgi:CRP-like cAMP-binding protein
MADHIKKIQFLAGRTIIVKGSINEGHFYIVQSGRIRVKSEVEFQEKELSRFEAGDTFGLVSAMTERRHIVTLVAETNVELIRISVQFLGKFLHNNKKICMKMLKFYAKELYALDTHLAQVNAREKYAQTPLKLVLDAHDYNEMGQKGKAAYALAHYIHWAENNPDIKSKQFLEKAKAQLKKIDPQYKLKFIEGNKLSFQNNEVIFLENEPSDCFYVLTRGSVKLFKLVNQKEFLLGVIKDGEIFGEMSLLNDHPRMASAIAETDTEILKLSQANFTDLVGEKLMQSIFESLSRRIWFGHQRLGILRMEDPVARLYVCLFALIQNTHFRTHSPIDTSKNFKFDFSVDILKRMSGVLKVNPERILKFLYDNNLEIKEQYIKVKKISVLEDRIFHYKNMMKRKVDKPHH